MIKYYKLVVENRVIGAVSSDDFRRYLSKHRVILVADEANGSYIELNGDFYRDNWMLPPTDSVIQFTEAKVLSITEEEYNALKQAEESGEDLPVEEEEPVEEVYEEPAEEEVDPITEATIEYVRDKKIKAMSAACNHTIVGGFDIALSDGETHHFSLTTQDQLNFISLASMIANGETEIPYHADGELCVFYSAEDMSAVIEEATNFKTYHVTYFNSLRNYIQSLDDIEVIAAIVYGAEIPEQYQSDVLKALIAQQSNTTSDSEEETLND